jgi:hypothetical protein
MGSGFRGFMEFVERAALCVSMRIYALVKAQNGAWGRFVPGTWEGLVGDRPGFARLQSTGLLPLGTTAQVALLLFALCESELE